MCSQRPVMARPGPAEVLTIRQLSGGKRTDLKRAALSRFVRTRLDIVPRGRISALVPINALPGSEITQSYAADNTHQTHSAQTAPDTEAIWGEAAFSADAASRPKMTQLGHGRRTWAVSIRCHDAHTDCRSKFAMGDYCSKVTILATILP